MTLRIARFLTICVAYVAWSPVLACSCAYSTLEAYYESNPNVFTAVVTSATIDKKGKVIAGFDVTEVFKGDIPFETLESYATGPCSLSTTVGFEYLFFLGDSGSYLLCSAPIILRPDKIDPWLEILNAYKSGETPSLSSPWHNYEYDGACSLGTEFMTTGTLDLSKLRIFYRYAKPVIENYRESELALTHPGFGFVALLMPTEREHEGPTIVIETQNREFIANWFDRRDVPHIYPYGFQLGADEVVAFAEELLNSSSAVLKGSISRFGPIDGIEIETTNAGSEIVEFVSCLKRGTRPGK